MVEGAKLLAGALGRRRRRSRAVFVDAGGRRSAPRRSIACSSGAASAGARVFELAPGRDRAGGRHRHTAARAGRGADARRRPRRRWPARPSSSCAWTCATRATPARCIRCRRRGRCRTRWCAATGTVDPFNPKTVRASAGLGPPLPVVVAGDARRRPRRARRRPGSAAGGGGAGGTRLHRGRPARRRSPSCSATRRAGSRTTSRTALDARVTIPMAGGAESLNVSTAAAVLCFDVARRRSNLHAMEEAR